MNRKHRRAAARNPSAADVLFAEALELHKAEQLQPAAILYRRVLEMVPNHHNALQFIGLLAYQIGEFDAAIGLLRQAIEANPKHFNAHSNLGITLMAVGQWSAAAEAFLVAIEAGGPAVCYSNLAETYRNMGLYPKAVDYAGLAVARSADLPTEQLAEIESKLLYIKTYGGLSSPEETLAEARAWYERYWQSVEAPEAADRNPDRRLRVGFLSADFRNHVIMQTTRQTLIMLTARDDIELFLYSSAAIDDRISAELMGMTQWRCIAGLSDTDAAQRVRDDKIDILIDLAGRTGGNRAGVFARRPAPILAGYNGPIATSGMPIDYFITDATVCPLHTVERMTETLWRLPRCYMTFEMLGEVPDVAPPPDGPLTFGSFNAPAKLSTATFARWAAVLRALPDSRLVLKGRGLNEPVTARRVLVGLEERGVDRQRVELLPATKSYTDHLAAYSKMHIALDTTPFSGGVTTCEALWMGVPVLTVPGKRIISRLSATLLAAAGFPDWAVESEEDLVATARILARSDLGVMRRRLRTVVGASSLCDGADMADTLATAFRAMWHRYLER